MFMALEYIDGPNLRQFVAAGGSRDIPAVIRCIRELSTVINRCHEHHVLHRDIKPLNIVLPGGKLDAPVLIDFGLSFNDAEEDDLTRLGDEIGNRFLRLPEHTLGNRSAASDVTQLAGIRLYLLTTIEPRVLVDDSGRKPHRREPQADALAALFQGRQLLRLQSVFDKAFDNDILSRYQLAPEFLTDVERALGDDNADDDNLALLLRRVGEIALATDRVVIARRRAGLDHVMQLTHGVVNSFAHEHSLRLSYSGRPVELTPNGGAIERNIAVAMDGQTGTFVTYRVEARDPDEFVVFADGTEIWRGAKDPTGSTLRDAVIRVAARRFVRDTE
jgi:serine/threonine-protein kinase